MPTETSTTLEISALATDGRGITRTEDGRVVFVPGVLPKELVEVSGLRKHGGVFVARAEQIVRASPERVSPPCPVYGRCGGCQLQHASAPAQTAARADFLLHNLKRLGRFDEPFLTHAKSILQVHAATQFGYRQRLRWHVEGGRMPEETRVGFRSAGAAHEGAPMLVETLACPLGQAALSTSGAIARESAMADAQARRKIGPWRAEVETSLDATGGVRARVVPERRGHGERNARTATSSDPSGPRAPINAAAPPSHFELPHPHLAPFRVHAESFVQPHRDALFLYVPVIENAIERFLARYSHALPDELGAWDLYCGSGSFSFVPFFLDEARRAGKRFRLTGVEGVARAVESAGENADANRARFSPGACADVRFETKDVAAFVREAKHTPSVIIADPPRDGMADALSVIVRPRRPSLFVYIACDSASLARDLAPLLAAGYALTELHLFDTFGQTAHFETAAVLVATGDGQDATVDATGNTRGSVKRP